MISLSLPLDGRVRKDLNVDAVDPVAPETSSQKPGLDLSVEFVVDHIRVHMIHGVVKVEMLEGVDIKVHLVVLAQPVVVYS